MMRAQRRGTDSVYIAWISMTPRPTVSPNHSPTMAPMSESEMPRRSATAMVGSAAGKRSFQKICAALAPKARINWIFCGSTASMPLWVFTVTGKKVR